MLIIEIGSYSKSFRLDRVSNGDITNDEFKDWAAKMKAENFQIPCNEAVRARRQFAEHVKKSFVYTSEAIEVKLQKAKVYTIHDLAGLRSRLKDLLDLNSEMKEVKHEIEQTREVIARLERENVLNNKMMYVFACIFY